ncbi:MAG: PAS domain-containing protein [Bacillota bacterium]
MNSGDSPFAKRDVPPLGMAIFQLRQLPGRSCPTPVLVRADSAFWRHVGRSEGPPGEIAAEEIPEDARAREAFSAAVAHARCRPRLEHRVPVPQEPEQIWEMTIIPSPDGDEIMMLRRLASSSIPSRDEETLGEFLNLLAEISLAGVLDEDLWSRAVRQLCTVAGAEAAILVVREGDRDFSVSAGGESRCRLLEAFDFDRVRELPDTVFRGRVAHLGDVDALLQPPRRGEFSNRRAHVVLASSEDDLGIEAVGLLLAPEGGVVERARLAESLTESLCSAAVSVATRERMAREKRRYRIFAENPQGITYQMTPGGSPHFLRGQVEEITGYDARDFLSGEVTWRDLVHRDDRASVLEENRRVAEEEDYRDDSRYRIVRADGEIRRVWDVRLGLIPGEESGRELLGGIIYDVSDTPVTSAASSSRQGILEDILETTLAGYWDWDIPGGVEYHSPAFAERLGYREDELPEVPETWRRLVFPEDLPQVLEGYRRHVASRGKIPFYNEVRYRHRDGSTVWMMTAGRVVEWDSDGTPRRMVGSHVDITRHKIIERALTEERERYERLTTHAGEVIFQLELDTVRVGYANPAAERVFGYDLEEYTRNPLLLARTIHPRSRPLALQALRAIRDGDYSIREVTLSWIARDGREVIVEHTVIPVVEATGEVRYIETIGRDVTKDRRNEVRLQFLSLHDRLTGLSNRARFEDELRRLEIGRGEEFPVTLMMADIDGLKLVNDSVGHEEGDKLLRGAAWVLKKTLRRSDLLARIGGDEFGAILLRTPVDEVSAIEERFREAVAIYNERNPNLPLSLSLGFATCDEAKGSLETVLHEADRAMYRDKVLRRASSKSALVQSLLSVLENRDYPGEPSVERLADLSVKTGKRMGLSARDLSSLELFTTFHDIGKVGVPDAILFKREPLTAEESARLNRHPEIGFRIASSCAELAPVAELILKHQELWDGSGYPGAVSGPEIPIQCRILTVVHRYLSSIQPEPGGAGLSSPEAREMLTRDAGAALDPRAVEAFLGVLDRENDAPKSDTVADGTTFNG